MGNWLLENGGTLIELVIGVVGLFALIATLTPNKSDNAIADTLWRLVNTLGANVGKSKNAD